MCLILKISMNVTLVTTRVQQHKYVSISREATHAWILYIVALLTSKLVTSELFLFYHRFCFIIFISKSPSKLNHACPPPQSVHVLSWEPYLQGQTFHHSVPTHGLVVRAQCACGHLPDAGHYALPWCLLHLPDKVRQRRKRVLHEGESVSNACKEDLNIVAECWKHSIV